MKLLKYKGFIIVNNSIWFDNDDSEHLECNSFMDFTSKYQAVYFIDDFHKNYTLINDRYELNSKWETI